ncbi:MULTISPECIES: DUF6249 domain-containing protein [unclassified Pseudoxanthomonas]|uniref:DUF6249 domain-containing protein n=1 Tax=unclassified Pseudoxanthomonas TaxID=2645906 RepID=UPI001784CA8B|nr:MULTISPECIES: DUF6249 domain-containing protein [unclassified Pseudoxanthomonas]MBD9470348.1 hypothetical protein [Pseudoxanthomonas sp. PXM01]MBD9477368.1 hypothetical protein [Pseudoxanthomonas sp. PXM02]
MAALWMIAIIVTASLAFVSVVIWLENRRKEREAHYRNEMAHRIAEAKDPEPLLAYVREIERIDAGRSRTKARTAGLIVLAVGLAMAIFFYWATPGTATFLVGLIPCLVGAALLLLSEVVMRPRPRTD